MSVLTSVRTSIKTRVQPFTVVLLSLIAVQAWAQFSSGIQGTVTDSSGIAVAGAKVMVTNTALGVERTAATDASGFFTVPSLAASTYLVEVQMQGFTTWQQKGLQLQVAETRTIAPVLQIGTLTTTVEVSAAPLALNLASPTTGSVVSETEVLHTPLPGQNVYSLGALSPGITGSAVTAGDNYTNEYAININAAGLRQEENGYQIDGAYTDTPSRGGGTSISPNPEIVESIDIRANDFDASKGRNAGANVEVFTKAGSNEVHGTADYYFLNNTLSARTEFASSVPTFMRNESGATIGGPIIKDKLFYFGGIDVLRSSATVASQTTVETQSFLNWAEANLPNNIATQILKAAPPLSYPTSGILTVGQLEASTPGYFAPPAGIPTNLPALGTADISYSIPKNGYQYSIRGDAYPNNTDRIYAEFMRTYDTTSSSNARPALNNGDDASSDFANLNWTHTFSSTLLNEAGVSMIRPYGSSLPISTMSIPYINVVGLNTGSSWGPGNFTQTTLGWRDILSDTVKNHTIKVGFNINRITEYDDQTGGEDRPTFNFNNLLDFIQDEATSESGTPVNLLTHQQEPYYRAYRATYMGFFLQDDWKVTRRFTLNLGLRFDDMPNFFNVLSPKLTNFYLGQGSYYQAVADGHAAVQANNNILNHNLFEATPRAGFAWDVRGNGKTALRGGFAMYASQPPYLHITDILASNLPNIYTPSVSVYQGATPVFQTCSPPAGFSISCPVLNTNNVALNSSGGIVGQRANLGAYAENYKFTQVEAWSLSLQQQLRQSLMLQINYSATAAHHLPVYNPDINRFAGDLIANHDVLTRLNPNFGTITYATSDGNSIGNYGSAQLKYLSSRGLSLQGIYTFGKALDTVSTAGSLDSGAITNTTTYVIQNGDLAAQRARSDFDIRNQFTFLGAWTLPTHYSSHMERIVLGGWELGGVVTLQSGLPFTVYTSAPFIPVYNSSGQIVGNAGGDYNADGYNFDVPDAPSFGGKTPGGVKNYLNGLFPASAFPAPALGTEGNLGRNIYNEPGLSNVDATLTRNFTTRWFFGENLHIQAQAEIYNLFNHPNLTSVESDLSSPLIGRATNQLPARSLQVHMRLSF